MLSNIFSSRRAIAISAVSVALAAGATAGVASIAAADPSAAASSDTVRVCVRNSGGDMRYESSSTKRCRSGETLVTCRAPLRMPTGSA